MVDAFLYDGLEISAAAGGKVIAVQGVQSSDSQLEFAVRFEQHLFVEFGDAFDAFVPNDVVEVEDVGAEDRVVETVGEDAVAPARVAIGSGCAELVRE